MNQINGITETRVVISISPSFLLVVYMGQARHRFYFDAHDYDSHEGQESPPQGGSSRMAVNHRRWG